MIMIVIKNHCGCWSSQSHIDYLHAWPIPFYGHCDVVQIQLPTPTASIALFPQLLRHPSTKINLSYALLIFSIPVLGTLKAKLSGLSLLRTQTCPDQ